MSGKHGKAEVLQVGDEAPDFTLESTGSEPVNLYAELREVPVVLFFYLRAFTPLCVSEACEFRDQLPSFEKAGARVFGISSDSSFVAKQFEKVFRLGFPLLLDPGQRVRKLYAVPPLLGVLPGRSTFVIGQNRRITGVTHAHNGSRIHIEESLQFLHRYE